MVNLLKINNKIGRFSMPTSEEFVQKCLQEKGDEYSGDGPEVEPGTPPEETTAWDCSELVQVKLNELGIDIPDGSTAQLEWCRSKGALIPLEQGINTRGALLLRVGHVAVSLGNGKTIEAYGTGYKVGEYSATNRTFTDAALVPGLDYEGQSGDPSFSESTEQHDKRPVLQMGSREGAVRFLQKKLKRLGFDPGPIDGIFGSLTEAAVKKFQTAHDIKSNGVVERSTWRAISKSSKLKRHG